LPETIADTIFGCSGDKMEERIVGNSDLKLSAIGLGCNNFGWQIDKDASRLVVDKALELGITHFDTADVYGDGSLQNNSETILGELLGTHRKGSVIATKFGMGSMDPSDNHPGASRQHIMRAVEDSLKRLRTDWIDIYYLHQPDPLTPMEETLRALDDLIHQGKIRYFACSNLPACKVTDAHETAKHLELNGFIASQNEYNLLNRSAESELLPALNQAGMGFIPYLPLAAGLLSGKYTQGALDSKDTRFGRVPMMQDYYGSDANWTIINKLMVYAAEHDRSLLELSFAWLLAKPGITSVIAGATKPEQVQSNASVSWVLTPEQVADIDALTS
jgi:aryl-alcohol dehydrogenase-like predicted oxidoreductase